MKNVKLGTYKETNFSSTKAMAEEIEQDVIRIFKNQSRHTPDFTQIATKYLKTLKPGQIPEEIFIQLLRLFPASCVEIVPVRYMKGSVQVLMVKRPPKDPVWPNIWHISGTVLSTADKTYEDAIKRVVEGELNNITDHTNTVFASMLLHKSERGMESAIIYYLELPFRIIKPKNSKWFNKNNLPKDMIQSHKEIIDLAVKSYLGIL